jgi:hypothetical protein
MKVLGFSAVAVPGATYLTAHIALMNDWVLLSTYCLN